MPRPVTPNGEDVVVEPLPPEALLDDFAPPLRAIAQRLREVVRTAVPDVAERVRPGWRLIGYDLSVGKRSVYFAWVWPQHEHVHLGFEHGWAMDDPGGLLHGTGITRRVRWLTFEPGDAIDADRCVALLHEAARVALMTRGERMLLHESRS